METFFQKLQSHTIKQFKNDLLDRGALSYPSLFFFLVDCAFSYPFTGLYFLDKEQKKSVDFQLDAYYSQIAYSQDFKAPEVMPPEMETDLYLYLIKNFFSINSIRLRNQR